MISLNTKGMLRDMVDEHYDNILDNISSMSLGCLEVHMRAIHLLNNKIKHYD